MASARAMSVAASLAVVLSVLSWAALAQAMYLLLEERAGRNMPWLIVACLVCLFGAGWLAGYTRVAAPIRSNIATILCILLIATGVWSQMAYG
jgi:hypothetical protein